MHMVTKIYNIARKLYIYKIPLIPKFLWTINRIIFACDISYRAEIQPTVDFQHNGLGVVISSGSIIGDNCIIYQNVTLGGNGKETSLNGHPIIGSNVKIYTGASVLGPVVIGDSAIIGAGAVVLDNIPEGAIAVGVPARVVKVKNT